MSQQRRDVQVYLTSKVAFAGVDLTSGNDGSEIDGIAFDTQDLALFPGGPPQSAVAYIVVSATQDSADTLTVAANWQTGPSSTQSFADVGTPFTSAVVRTLTADGTNHDIVKMPLSNVWASLDQFVRIQATVTMSDTDQGTLVTHGVLVFEGGQTLSGDETPNATGL